MFLKNRAPQSSRSAVSSIAMAGVIRTGSSFCLALSLAGCGSGVSNLLPNVSAPSNPNIPSGPILGYIFSSADGTLRAMLGVRGAARVSASIVPPGVYVAGDATTASGSALLEDENGSLFAFALPQSQPIHVADGLPPNLRVSFAPSGQTAIAYASGGSSVVKITGLPVAPQVQTINLSSAGRLVSGIVSDSGTIVVATQGTSTQVGTLAASGQFSRLASVGPSPSFNFLSGSSSDAILLADGTANTLSIIRGVSSGPSIQTLGVAGLNSPVAVAASHDGRWAAVANGSDSTILRVDLATGTPVATVVCACKPSQMSSLSGNAVFRVNSLGTGPVWTIDLAGATPQLLFVPAIVQATP